MKAAASLFISLFVVGVAVARPSLFAAELIEPIARLLNEDALATEFGVNPDQVDVLEAVYDVAAPALEDILQDAKRTSGVPASEFNPVNVALVEQLEKGDIPAVEELLGVAADPNAPAADGNTPLTAALATGSPELVSALLEHGADTNKPAASGETPLYLAITNGTAELVQLLLQYGANANLATASGETPLLTALEANHTDLVGPLLDHGADVNLAGPDGVTPFQWVLMEVPINATQVSQFIDHGADVNRPDPEGAVPLELAAGDPEVERLLMAAGATPPPALEG